MTAATMTESVDMMGRAADPLAHIKRGDVVSLEALRGGQHVECCYADSHPVGRCARKQNHPAHWQHIGLADTYMAGAVTSVWTDDKALDVSDAPAELEGEETPLLDVKAGAMCRFRNRRDLLMILGLTKKNGDTVEALNLTRQRFCRLKVDRLVERKVTDPDPTQEQMAWVAEFLADRKHAIGQIGLREVQTRRWSRKEMEASLAKADLTPPPLRYSGRLDLGINFELPPGVERPNSGQLLAMIKEAMEDKLAELSTDKITLKTITHAEGVGMIAA